MVQIDKFSGLRKVSTIEVSIHKINLIVFRRINAIESWATLIQYLNPHSTPNLPIQLPVIDRFGEVVDLDIGFAFEVGDSARHA